MAVRMTVSDVMKSILFSVSNKFRLNGIWFYLLLIHFFRLHLCINCLVMVQCIQKVFTLHLFHILSFYNPVSKWIWFNFSSKFYTQEWQNEKVLLTFFQIKKNKKNQQQHNVYKYSTILFSILSLLKHPTSSGLFDYATTLAHVFLWGCLPFIFAEPLKLHQVGCGVSMQPFSEL